MDPNTLRYTKTHEWVSTEGDIATIGISDFAVKQLTDLVYISLPAVGRKLQPSEAFGEVESVKAVSDLYAPVAGEVVEVNNALANDLSALSDDPYGRGWMLKIRLSDPSAVGKLMDRKTYEAHVASEDH